MWLLEKSVKDAIETAVSSGFVPTAQQQADFMARAFADGNSGGPRLLAVAGDKAEIAITGVLTGAPNFFAWLFGGDNTTYSDIIAAVAAANQDPSIKTIDYRIDSPGGEFDGLFQTIEAMNQVKKPTRVVGVNKVASAAYAIAAQADTIEAANAATRFGSVGVVATFGVSDDVVEITSSNAPKKRPDVRTEEGKAVVREQLDAMERVFMEAIAGGRGTTVEKIIADYGQGGMLLAGDAMKRGMIDTIAKPALAVVSPAKSTTADGGKRGTKAMDLKELKAQHPEIYAAAVQEGVNQERERVTGHIIMGEASGHMKLAMECIQDGSGFNPVINAKYNAAAMNKGDRGNRASDEQDVEAAVNGKQVKKGDDVSKEDAFAAAVLAEMGVSNV